MGLAHDRPLRYAPGRRREKLAEFVEAAVALHRVTKHSYYLQDECDHFDRALEALQQPTAPTGAEETR